MKFPTFMFGIESRQLGLLQVSQQNGQLAFLSLANGKDVIRKQDSRFFPSPWHKGGHGGGWQEITANLYDHKTRNANTTTTNQCFCRGSWSSLPTTSTICSMTVGGSDNPPSVGSTSPSPGSSRTRRRLLRLLKRRRAARSTEGGHVAEKNSTCLFRRACNPRGEDEPGTSRNYTSVTYSNMHQHYINIFHIQQPWPVHKNWPTSSSIPFPSPNHRTQPIRTLSSAAMRTTSSSKPSSSILSPSSSTRKEHLPLLKLLATVRNGSE